MVMAKSDVIVAVDASLHAPLMVNQGIFDAIAKVQLVTVNKRTKQNQTETDRSSYDPLLRWRPST
jgi:hypothetical protein